MDSQPKRHRCRWRLAFVGLALIVSICQNFSLRVVSLSPTVAYQSIAQQASDGLGLTSASSSEVGGPRALSGERILMTVLSYDHGQARRLHRLLESVRSICEAGASLDVLILSTIPWPLERIRLAESTLQCHRGGVDIADTPSITLEIQLYSPRRAKRLVNVHKQLFYDRLEGAAYQQHPYTLYVYTEEDQLISPRHVSAYLRETRQLEAFLSATTTSARTGTDTAIPAAREADADIDTNDGVLDSELAGTGTNSLTAAGPQYQDYSIGFMRFEWELIKTGKEDDKDDHPARFPNQMIWEHNWNISSTEAFLEQHVIAITNANGDMRYYFSPKGDHHQGMYMATPPLLRAWRDRPPSCRFNETVSSGNPREHGSSLHLYNRNKGCNVTQLFPLSSSFHDLLVHHMSNHQHLILHKFLPKWKTLHMITAQQLDGMVLAASHVVGRGSSHEHVGGRQDEDKQVVTMKDMESAERYENDERSPPDLSYYHEYVKQRLSVDIES